MILPMIFEWRKRKIKQEVNETIKEDSLTDLS